MQLQPSLGSEHRLVLYEPFAVVLYTPDRSVPPFPRVFTMFSPRKPGVTLAHRRVLGHCCVGRRGWCACVRASCRAGEGLAVEWRVGGNRMRGCVSIGR